MTGSAANRTSSKPVLPSFNVIIKPSRKTLAPDIQPVSRSPCAPPPFPTPPVRSLIHFISSPPDARQQPASVRPALYPESVPFAARRHRPPPPHSAASGHARLVAGTEFECRLHSTPD